MPRAIHDAQPPGGATIAHYACFVLCLFHPHDRQADIILRSRKRKQKFADFMGRLRPLKEPKSGKSKNRCFDRGE
jgi:hypothetical protein